MPMDEVVILDMDENVIESPHVEDLMMMPYDVISQLKHVVKKESSGYGDNAAKAFLIAMVSMIGGYRKALKFREVRGREGERGGGGERERKRETKVIEKHSVLQEIFIWEMFSTIFQ